MNKWMVKLWEPDPEKNCTSHRDRPALAILKRQAKKDGPAVNTRYYCLECLGRKLVSDPFMPVHRPPQPTQE